MSTDPVMRPDQATNPGEDAENTVSSGAGAKARPRDKRPEAQYPPMDRMQGVDRDSQPGGPVTIGVKGAPDDVGPQAAGQDQDKATGAGSRAAPSLPRE